MAENTVPSINLLPQKGESLVTQFLNWTLTIGRLLIILVEMVALGTFLYRFNLDMEIVDLHDKIQAQSFIVANFQKSEDTFRDIQSRLALVKQYNGLGDSTSTIFSDIAKMGQGHVTFKNLTVETQDAKIEASAPTATALGTFVNELRKHPAITAVVIDKVQNNTSNAMISVSITATLKSKAFDKDQPTDNTNGIQPILDNK